MGFPTSIADEVLVRCGRHCCLCGVYAGQKIELHHIVQAAEGGDDSADNCIPLCLNCHAEVKSYNPKHPKGRRFTEKELKGHRDKYYAQYEMGNRSSEMERKEEDFGNLFESPKVEDIPSWGYKEQEKICPIHAGNLILIAGYAGTKKSTYVHHVINWNLRQGHRVVYGCLKEQPTQVGIDIIAEAAHISANDVRTGMVTEESWNKIAESQTYEFGKNLVLLPFDKVTNSNSILSIVENAEANIVVLDDFNGIDFGDKNSVEKFLYQLKSVAGYSNTVVICIYNLNIPKPRIDMRPVLSDFPEDYFYRMFDIVQCMFRPDVHNEFVDRQKGVLEVINLKGAWKNPWIFNMVLPDEVSCVLEKND